MRIKYFNRYELKYVLPVAQSGEIIADLLDHLDPDDHSESDGRYTVTSLYFDTADYKAYWDKIEGHRLRRKVRIRVYGEQVVVPETDCFLEIKQRNNKALQKKRIYIPYETAFILANGGEPVNPLDELSEVDQAVRSEIQYLAQALSLQPACVVRYDRQAFNGNDYDPGLRVTFDTNLTCRAHALSLLTQASAPNNFFLPPDWAIMEIKVNNRVPYWLSEVLSKHRCTIRRVSKYCSALEKTKVTLREGRVLQ